MNALNNVARISQNRVYDHILSFLRDKGTASKNTQESYESDIRQFFSYMRHKHIEDLVSDDLKFVNSDMMGYKVYLSEEYADKDGKGYKNNTVNRKLSVIQSLYDFLKTNDYDVNPNSVKVKSLPDDSQRIGFLSPDEAFLLANLALTTEKKNAKMKYALILTAAATSLRKKALLSLQYSEIRKSDDDDNKYLIRSVYFDKGKLIEKEIHKDLYDLLLGIKDENKNDDLIFHIDEKSAHYMIKRLCEKAGIDPKRNISFHSLKKSGIALVYELTNGDMAAVTAQGGWSNPNTAYRHYLKPQKNIAGMAMFEKIEDHVFDELSREELLTMVKGIKNGLGLQLKREAQKIINART